MSRQLDSLLKGLAVFQEGMQTRAVAQAIADSTKEVDAANRAFQQGLIKEEEMKATMSGIATNAALRMSQAGANASQVETVASRIGLSPAQMQAEQLGLQKAQMGAQKEQTKLNIKLGEADAKFKQTAQKDFMGLPDVRKQTERMQQARTGLQVLDAGSSVADQAVKTFMARAAGAVGDLTEKERADFAGSSALWRSAERVIEKFKTGKLTEEDREDLKILARVMEKSAQKELNKRALEFTKGRSKALEGVNIGESDLLNIISPQTAELTQAKKIFEERINSGKLQGAMLDAAKKSLEVIKSSLGE